MRLSAFHLAALELATKGHQAQLSGMRGGYWIPRGTELAWLVACQDLRAPRLRYAASVTVRALVDRKLLAYVAGMLDDRISAQAFAQLTEAGRDELLRRGGPVPQVCPTHGLACPDGPLFAAPDKPTSDG